jgi:phosphoglycolate phosphatase
MGRSALLFDLDGTLVDSALDIVTALSHLSVERGGRPVPTAKVRELVSQGVEVLVSQGLGKVAGDNRSDVAAFRSVLRAIRPDPAMIFRGVVHALTALQDAGHRCAIVTNKPEGLARQLLDQLDLARFFDDVVGGDTLVFAKPRPEPLQYAMKRLGATSSSTFMIGDSPVDGAAALAAGVRFVLYEEGYGAGGCNDIPVAARFADFSQLAEIVA